MNHWVSWFVPQCSQQKKVGNNIYLARLVIHALAHSAKLATSSCLFCICFFGYMCNIERDLAGRTGHSSCIQQWKMQRENNRYDNFGTFLRTLILINKNISKKLDHGES